MGVVQALQAQYTESTALSTDLPIDDTVPTSSEGVEVLSQAITLNDPANKVLVTVCLFGHADENPWAAALFRGTTCINAAASLVTIDDSGSIITMEVLDAPGSVGPHTYSVRVGNSSGMTNPRLNGAADARRFGGAAKCTLTLLELEA